MSATNNNPRTYAKPNRADLLLQCLEHAIAEAVMRYETTTGCAVKDINITRRTDDAHGNHNGAVPYPYRNDQVIGPLSHIGVTVFDGAPVIGAFPQLAIELPNQEAAQEADNVDGKADGKAADPDWATPKELENLATAHAAAFAHAQAAGK